MTRESSSQNVSSRERYIASSPYRLVVPEGTFRPTRRVSASPPAETQPESLGFWPLHESQRQIEQSASRFNVLNCGRRYGKTEYLLRKCAQSALSGQPVAYFAPTYPMLRWAYRALSNRLLAAGGRALASEWRIELPGGGSIDCWSLSDGANRCRGQKYALVALDEVALVDDLLSAWEESIRPTLTDLRGEAWFASTPRRGGGFEELYRRGEDGGEWAAWTVTTYENPFIDPQEIEAARAGMSDQAFRQEYMAEFEAAETDLVFPEFSVATHVKPAPCAWEETKWRIAGVDLGGGDPTAIVPIGVTANERVHQYGEFYRRGDVAVDDLAEYLYEWHNRAPFNAIVVDPSAKAIPESLRRLGLPVFPANNARGEGLEVVRWILGSGRFSIDPAARNSIAEFPGYRWAKRRDAVGERYATSTPVDHHADAMDARRYALMALQQGVMRQSTIQRAVYRPASYVGARHG